MFDYPTFTHSLTHTHTRKWEWEWNFPSSYSDRKIFTHTHMQTRDKCMREFTKKQAIDFSTQMITISVSKHFILIVLRHLDSFGRWINQEAHEIEKVSRKWSEKYF